MNILVLGAERKRVYKDITGNKYGFLEVLGKSGYRGKNILWKCICHKCNKEKECTASQLKPYTKSCGCIRTERDWNSANWKGIGEMSQERLSLIKRGAIKRNKEYSLSGQYLWDLFLKQDRKCALTGLFIKFGNKGRDETTASLDRIDNTKGYIPGNVQWVHKHINAMKLNHTEEYFIKLCQLVINYNKA